MLAFQIHSDAAEDLDQLWELDETVAADLTVLIEEISGSERLLAALRRHQARDGQVQVSRMLRFEVWGRSVWRLRVYELVDPQQLLPYRLIYAWHGEVAYLLAVMHRNRNYEQDTGLVERIRRACRGIGIPAPP